MCWDSLSALTLKSKLWDSLETHPISLNAGKISPALNQFQSCHNQGWKFNFFAVEMSILKMSGARLLIFWQLTDRLATTGQLTKSCGLQHKLRLGWAGVGPAGSSNQDEMLWSVTIYVAFPTPLYPLLQCLHSEKERFTEYSWEEASSAAHWESQREPSENCASKLGPQQHFFWQRQQRRSMVLP